MEVAGTASTARLVGLTGQARPVSARDTVGRACQPGTAQVPALSAAATSAASPLAAEEAVSPSPHPPPPPQQQEDTVVADETASPLPLPPRYWKEESFRRVVAVADPRIPLAPVLEQWSLSQGTPRREA
ncbi:hypothetical protein E2562_012689 [Oryza meyeriana var. granulata]|uniref:Uncharacterized protein n=1 Tax=Oryza meyeriana var. granulata TaxID=110450 RepID=A0A6G1CET5_9ORYZ|nr:hypothetical protein E2562_012689 [Oryza meyeriana var. granulata]KAF0898998.1 hypothetical protein E2562_012689 [Oryza meyeriana var. granulata]